MFRKKYPFYKQLDNSDCGPTCLKMIAKYYGKSYSLERLRQLCQISRVGVSMQGISEAAEVIGFRTLPAKLTFDKLKESAPLPCIVYWKQRHFVVVNHVFKRNLTEYVIVTDPAFGQIKFSREEFERCWLNKGDSNEESGICLLLEPTPDFYNKPQEPKSKKGLRYLASYLRPYNKYIVQVILGLLLGSLIQLIFPFVTQAMVDIGISNRDLNFISLMLIGQIVLFFSMISIEFIRSWILLHINARINIALISDFLIKLMKLPIGFFDSKKVGDLMQRISDHSRIQTFLTSSSIQILFAFTNLIVFSIVLSIYNLRIFIVFIVGSICYLTWVMLFMKKRRELDNKSFAQLSSNQNNLIQLITGMQEIKLNNCEKQKRWEWEKVQENIFRINFKSLALNQYQEAGGVIFNQSKNIFITYLAARSVVSGDLSLGMMLSIQYILGQLNAPLNQMITFFRAAQDAKISIERFSEIHEIEPEQEINTTEILTIPENKNIELEKLEFRYPGSFTGFSINDLSLIIPGNCVTAIVGSSGSGKTTLLKLLLGFYKPSGKIIVGGCDLNNINEKIWRSNIGCVMQDGFIFSDSILNNIGLSDEHIDKERLDIAVKVANLENFVNSLPLGINTRIGAEGVGLSQGQRQRILIARAVYKNPEYMFFDEATNALDAKNERVIMNNLERFFINKTVLVVAHRLSTVKNADQIVVLDNGKVAEIGTHKTLTSRKGLYYKLVKNQLELGS